MKVARFLDPAGSEKFGIPLDRGKAELLEGPPLGPWHRTGQTTAIHQLLAPVRPSSIFCIGLNYRQHAAEMGVPLPKYPVLFMKSPASVQAPGGPIEIPTALPSQRVDYEAELAIIIGQSAKNVPRHRALDYVLGYTCANDVSARDWQKDFGGSQWCRGKTFDTFCPLGPVLVTPDELNRPNHLRLRTVVNGELLQDASTSDMIFDIPALIEFLSGSTTLLPGTVILTGTPSGVGMGRTPPRWLMPGDQVTIEIEGIGSLTNPVRSEPQP
ncbi:MAG: hypothetical protein OHK005_06750 [Candidatus Methylacidiphilales bacterium]